MMTSIKMNKCSCLLGCFLIVALSHVSGLSITCQDVEVPLQATVNITFHLDPPFTTPLSYDAYVQKKNEDASGSGQTVYWEAVTSVDSPKETSPRAGTRVHTDGIQGDTLSLTLPTVGLSDQGLYELRVTMDSTPQVRGSCRLAVTAETQLVSAVSRHSAPAPQISSTDTNPAAASGDTYSTAGLVSGIVVPLVVVLLLGFAAVTCRGRLLRAVQNWRRRTVSDEENQVNPPHPSYKCATENQELALCLANGDLPMNPAQSMTNRNTTNIQAANGNAASDAVANENTSTGPPTRTTTSETEEMVSTELTTDEDVEAVQPTCGNTSPEQATDEDEARDLSTDQDTPVMEPTNQNTPVLQGSERKRAEGREEQEEEGEAGVTTPLLDTLSEDDAASSQCPRSQLALNIPRKPSDADEQSCAQSDRSPSLQDWYTVDKEKLEEDMLQEDGEGHDPGEAGEPTVSAGSSWFPRWLSPYQSDS